MHNPAPVLENDTQSPLGIWHTHRSPNLSQKTRPYYNQEKKKRIYKIVDFVVLAYHRIKLRESEKKDKYLDLARQLKILWNMRVTIIPIVIGAFGTVTKGLLKGVEDLEVDGRVDTIPTTALLRTTRIPRRMLETWGDLLSLKLQWKSSANADVKNSKWVNNNVNTHICYRVIQYYSKNVCLMVLGLPWWVFQLHNIW